LISRQEVMDFSREFALAPSIVEKDYVLGWILAGISNHTKLCSDWVFKGGTGAFQPRNVPRISRISLINFHFWHLGFGFDLHFGIWIFIDAVM